LSLKAESKCYTLVDSIILRNDDTNTNVRNKIKHFITFQYKISRLDCPSLLPVLFAMVCPAVFVVPDARILQECQELDFFLYLENLHPVLVLQLSLQLGHVSQNCFVLTFV
jgi:hypothetical protein